MSRKVVLVVNVKNALHKCNACCKVFISEQHLWWHIARRHSPPREDPDSVIINSHLHPNICPDPIDGKDIDLISTGDVSSENDEEEDIFRNEHSNSNSSSTSVDSERVRQIWISKLDNSLIKAGFDPFSQGITNLMMETFLSSRITQLNKGTLKKSGIKKKDSSSATRFEKKASSKTVSFEDSKSVQSSPAVTPARRETYSVVKPVYNKHGITPTIRSPQPFSTNLTVVEADYETYFVCTRIISSSPQSKGNVNEIVTLHREPLREYNYNTRQTISIKENAPTERKAFDISERRISDSLFSTDFNFDRDSLESPIVCNRSNSPTFDTPSFSSFSSRQSDIYSRGDTGAANNSKCSEFTFSNSGSVSEEKEKPFYLTQNATPNSTFTQNDSLFFNQVPAYLLQNQIISDPHFEETFPIFNASSPKNTCSEIQESQFVSLRFLSFTVSFDISPARPSFRSPRKATKIKKEIIRKCETEDTKFDTITLDESSIFCDEKDKISLFNEPDYLLHPYGVTTITDPFSRLRTRRSHVDAINNKRRRNNGPSSTYARQN